MLKRISVADLRVGMYLQELGGAWLDHPFWRSSFRIEDAQMLQKIRGSGIREAWIDTAKGLDIAGGVTEAEADAEIELDLQLDRKSTRLNSSHNSESRMPSSA
jgi:hypothetical protein